MNQFLWGALATSASVVGLFFLRFWTLSRDRLFLFFTLAFWVLAFHWVLLAIVVPAHESRPLIYVLRLVAFIVILVGIVDKNRRRPASG
jgi:hypothetical protein